jgi:hypothetical protein
MNITAAKFYRFSFGSRIFDSALFFNNISLVCHNFVGLSDSAIFVGDIWPGTVADVEMQSVSKISDRPTARFYFHAVFNFP